MCLGFKSAAAGSGVLKCVYKTEKGCKKETHILGQGLAEKF